MDQSLRYWTLGPPPAAERPRPTLIMLHGMRDVGRSLLPVAEQLAGEWFVVLPDLRGHGGSVRPGSYAFSHFLQDLRALQQHLGVARFALLGHSLGGHIACRFAALFPGAVGRLIVVEGLGPPLADSARLEPAADLDRLAERLDASVTARQRRTGRVLPDLAAAAERLQAGNPRLAPALARQLASWLTEPAAGGLTWAFDGRAQEVFLDVSNEGNLLYWGNVQAPTLLVQGDAGHEYWRASFNQPGYSGHYAEGELESRRRTFKNAEIAWIAGAGHQVHYDQPDVLARICADFLNPHAPTFAAPGDTA